MDRISSGYSLFLVSAMISLRDGCHPSHRCSGASTMPLCCQDPLFERRGDQTLRRGPPEDS